VIIDGGNSFFEDTERRVKSLQAQGILFVGMASRARKRRPMGTEHDAGWAEAAWPHLRPMLEAIAAKAEDGHPAWRGWTRWARSLRQNGAQRHRVRRHAADCRDIRLVAPRGGLSDAELSTVFMGWNQGLLKSYLIEITGNIFSPNRSGNRPALVDLILDEAAQKGTQMDVAKFVRCRTAIPTINARWRAGCYPR